MATIDALPDELLLMIFKLIPGYDVCMGAARVNRRWARVSRSYAIHLHELTHLKRLHHCPNALLITVNLTQRTPLLKKLESDLAPYLTELSIHGEMPLLDNELVILQSLINLRHLDVFARSRLYGSHLLPVVKRLHSFVINETVCKGFLCTLSDATQLYSLNMYGNGLYYPKSDLLTFLRVSANRLRELTLRCNELKDVAYQIGTRVIGVIIRELPQSIYELVLCGLSLGNEHVETLTQRLPGLHTLELCICNISCDALTNLVSLLPNLQYFDTDVRFNSQHKKTMLKHPTLKKVRCCLEDDEVSANEHAMFLPGNARYKYALLRGDGQGYRADLFHYWSLKVPLEIIPERE